MEIRQYDSSFKGWLSGVSIVLYFAGDGEWNSNSFSHCRLLIHSTSPHELVFCVDIVFIPSKANGNSLKDEVIEWQKVWRRRKDEIAAFLEHNTLHKTQLTHTDTMEVDTFCMHSRIAELCFILFSLYHSIRVLQSHSTPFRSNIRMSLGKSRRWIRWTERRDADVERIEEVKCIGRLSIKIKRTSAYLSEEEWEIIFCPFFQRFTTKASVSDRCGVSGKSISNQ